MPVLTKINQLRQHIHSTELKKTGRNTLSNYNYFELADFLVPALKKCFELNLSAVVSFTADLATMTVTDLDDGSQFLITSPMSSASLKACHEVQNLGAVQTYLRRYLWVALLEIVEHDAIDSSAGPVEKKPKQQPERTRALKVTNAIKAHLSDGRELGALQEWEIACEEGEDFAGLVWNSLSTPERNKLRELKTNSVKEAA